MLGKHSKLSPHWRKIRHLDDLALYEELEDFQLQSDVCPDCGCITKHCSCIYEAQMGTPAGVSVMPASSGASQENVHFTDQVTSYTYDVDSTMDPTRYLQDSNDATLEHFFSRPLKIHQLEWATGTPLTDSIDPWHLYFTNPRVSNRLANFNLLRADLKIKIVINGNGFQYGRAMVAYLPFKEHDTMSTNSALVPNDMIGTSQLPHIFLDPTTSQGGEMTLPMFHYDNYLSVPDTQVAELGDLFFRSLNDLKHANGATDTVTISVFAWAVNVSMSVLTTVEPDTMVPQSGFEAQMGEVEQANSSGVVSGPATTVAKWAAYLTKVPMISPFAMATNIAATATANIAKIFGYCRPAVTRNPEPYRPTLCSSLALTNTPDTALKLTVDDKQELTIDPRISGVGGADPMNIREIAKRETYLTTFAWPIGTAPETMLWNSRIDPVIWGEEAGPPQSFHFPACCFAALPFKYWTGSMKFRFQIVASNYHKGRLKFVYDPNFLATNEYNTNYLRIVDISEEQDFTIELGNGQPYTLLDHHLPGVNSVTQLYSTTPYAVKAPGNGVIGVYVVNELTVPNSTIDNDIEINVFVSMGDDFEVFVPDDHFQKFHFGPEPQPAEGFVAQSGEVPNDTQDTTEPSAPLQSMAETVGMSESQDSKINKVFVGEAISSFRTILKRYNLWNCMGAYDTVEVLTAGRMPVFPYFRGYYADAPDQTIVPESYSYCNTVMLHWVRAAFSGWRGSIRYKMIPRGYHTDYNRVEVQRATPVETAKAYDTFIANQPTYATIKDARKSIMNHTSALGEPNYIVPFTGLLGEALTLTRINGALEFEVPYYSRYRFTPGKTLDFTSQVKTHGAWDYRIEFTGDTTSVYDIHCAAGEDFQVYFFTGLPRAYYEPLAPA